MFPGLAGLARSGRITLAAVPAALAVGAVLAAVALGLGLRLQAGRDAEREIRQLGIVLGEQTARSLQSLDVALAEIAADAGLDSLQDAAQFRMIAATPAMQQTLRARAAGLPQAADLMALAADGTLLASAGAWPPEAADLADGTWFQQAQAATGPAPSLSTPTTRRGGGRVFHVVHRIASPAGVLLGVLLGSIDLDSVAAFHAAIGLPPGMAVALVRRDGAVLARFPADFVRPPGMPAAGTQPAGSGLVHGQPLADFPAMLEVSIDHAAIYAGWRRHLAMLVAGMTCALAGMLLLRGGLHRQCRGLAASRAAMQQESLLLETTLAHMDQGLMMVTADQRVAVCNDRAIALLGLPPGLMHGRPPFDMVLDWQARAGEFAACDPEARAVHRSGGPLDRLHTYERRRPNGICLEVRTVPLPGGGMVRTFTDVTLRRLADDQVSYAAHHDALTGLSNRALFAQRLDDAVLAAQDGNGPAVLFIDIDRFKLVNDMLGHRAGDELLRQAAARMRDAVRDAGTLARMGGDEFALVLPAAACIETAGNIAQRLLSAVRRPYRLAEGPARIGVSIGIAGYGVHGNSADELLRNADLALHRAKATGRDTACVFDPLLDGRTQGELLLEGALQYALQEGQFTLAYQPIWDIRSNNVIGAEALVRWQHPTKGIVSPAHFIPLAERTGLIVPLGRWVMETACREALTWASPVCVSVNVAPAQLLRRELIDEVRDLLAATGLPPARLKLEITEGQTLDETDEVIGVMAGLRELGVRLALDDFGTGHSSLSTLRAFPFSDLKIDRSFTQDILRDARARGLLEAILQVCRVLELDCVAEGVETDEQLEQVRALGCTHAQGYLMGRPEPPEAIRRTLWRAAAQGRHALPDPVVEPAAAPRTGTPY